MSAATLFAQGAPQGLLDDLRRIDELPPAAQQGLWPLVAQNIGAELGADAERAAERFSAEHEVPMDLLVAVVRSTRTVLRRAAALDLPTERLHADLHALTNDRPLARRIGALYDKARLPLRAEATIGRVERFGAVLTDADLRVDMVSITRADPGKGVPVGMLSLSYRERGEDKQQVLQVTPAMIQKLRALFGAS